jgi:outer membrane protein TolC
MNRRAAMAAVAVCVLAPTAAGSETLADAIALAYQTNPLIRSQRAALRAIDEEYVQAMAGYRPTLTANGQGGYQNANLDQQNFAGGYTNSHEQAGTGQIDLSFVQPLYTGGAVRARVNGASADIMAGRENLRRAEGQLLLQVITAYVDVRRDREIVEVLEQAVADLDSIVAEARAGSVAGQTSRTDVDLAQGRLLNARLQILQARAKLGVSQASYLDLVGQNPGALEPEPELKSVPDTIDKAFDVAEANNPALNAAIQTELAARAKVAETKAAGGPTLSVKLDGSVAPLAPYLPRQYDRSVTGRSQLVLCQRSDRARQQGGARCRGGPA